MRFDREHLWHPYTSLPTQDPVYPVVSAQGVHLHLNNQQSLVDGMSSWWSAIHGYNHPVLNDALLKQSKKMAHVMFGGLTHEPAIDLGQKLMRVLPQGLERIFFCDSGSVAVEVAIKMALQYWIGRGVGTKKKMLSVYRGYHGDTFAAMSVSDPHNGMHSLFAHQLAQQIFATEPPCSGSLEKALADMESKLAEHHKEVAAVIIEPIVQGAGGMRIYSPAYLKALRELCDAYGVLLILDEIATGFGRTGTMFACEQAEVVADIMCIGKALSAGYMTLAATITHAHIAESIGAAGVPFMHGPTYMANPLACAVASASLDLLSAYPWQERVRAIEKQLKVELVVNAKHTAVSSVRVKGAIGVVEMKEPVDVAGLCKKFVQAGVWIRPYSNLIYVMPPYIIEPDQLTCLTDAIGAVIQE